MADAATMLLQDNSVLEFLKVLNGANMQSQANGYADFFKSVDDMQNQLNDILIGVKNMKRQLDEIKDRKNLIKRAFTAVFAKIESDIKAAQEQLNALKEKIIEGAKNAVRSFKENGIAALNGVLRFFKVKSQVQAAIKSTNAVIESCNKAHAKIDAISEEYHAVGLHTRNLGRAITGKEAITVPKDKGKLAKVLQAFVKFRKSISAGIKKKCENLFAKLESLETTAQQNRERAAQRKAARKPSLMKRMEDHQKNDVPLQQTPDKSKKREEVI